MQHVELFRQTVTSFKKIHPEELKNGSLSEIFNAKCDCDLLSWFVSLPLDPDSSPDATKVRNLIRKSCMGMYPCIKTALASKMLASDRAEEQDSLDCLVIRYEELERLLFELARIIDPAAIKLLQINLS